MLLQLSTNCLPMKQLGFSFSRTLALMSIVCGPISCDAYAAAAVSFEGSVFRRERQNIARQATFGPTSRLVLLLLCRKLMIF
jgi:hypothetical protein